ncbi:MAG TPA: YeeE/YedE family protein [Sulfuricaulis sp.]
MSFTVHNEVLLLVFLVALVIGAVGNKTNFCTMGAVSDWVNMGDTGRMRAWLFAIAIALTGLVLFEVTGAVTLPSDSFPPYRTSNFAWLRYVLGGLLFGVGMTLGSGCGQRTMVRVGQGNLKSLVVLIIAGICAYLMLWTDFFSIAFMSWINPTTIELSKYGILSQEIGTIVGGVFNIKNIQLLHWLIGGAVALTLFVFIFKSPDFRSRFDNFLGGGVMGLAVVAGWYITGGALREAWEEYAAFATTIPSRVAVQSYTFISPMGDTARYLMQPTQMTMINFGVMALTGVIVGSFLYAIFTRKFRIEWFASKSDFLNHAVGGVLMGFGGVLAMGCTIGQGVTGVSTLALGSVLALLSIVFGSALTMKVQYYMLDEQGFWRALHMGLSDMKLLPAPGGAKTPA